MTSPVEEGWPARLEQITGKKVQNYGTSAFGPQQELYVLQDYAIQHQPRNVVLAFFAGNDLFDAERFDRWERAGTSPAKRRRVGVSKKDFGVTKRFFSRPWLGGSAGYCSAKNPSAFTGEQKSRTSL